MSFDVMGMWRLLRVIVLGGSLLLSCGIGEAQQSEPGPSPTPLITNVSGRHTTSLNGKWHVIVDPYDNGYYDYRYKPKADGYFLDQKAKSPSDLVEYNFDTAQEMNVPGDWNSQDQRLFLY